MTLMKKALLILTALTFAASAFAGHTWNDYHWASSDLAPTVVDQTSSPLYDVPAAVVEWAALSTPIQPVLASGRKGKVKVVEGYSPFWLGLARIFIEDGHITKGEIKLNTTLLENYGFVAADHVLCQELGHVLGLNHWYDTDTCMNDTPTLANLLEPLATSPNLHDTDQLNLVYDHTDATSGGGKGGGRGGKKGYWLTVHVFPAP